MKHITGLFSLLALFALTTNSYALQPRTGDVITVVDEHNQPVPNATILLGYEQNNPFPNNVFTTDAQGIAGVPADWKAALPITVQATGFITKTDPTAQPGMQTLKLTHQEPATAMEVKGTSTDFGRLQTDGKVDFGLVIPALSREQMLSFDLSTVISPQNDTIEVIGNTVNIPTNITLPNQDETYIFPINLNKPDYKVYLRTPGQYQMGITHGQFPLQRVVDAIRGGKSFLEVVNYFDFKEMGQKSVDVNGNMSGVNMPVNQTSFDANFAVKSPAFANGLVMMSLGLLEQNGVFLPTDVKRFQPNQSYNLKTNKNAGNVFALSLLMENKSAILTALTETLQTWFAPLSPTAIPAATKPQPRAMQNFNRLSFTLTPATNGAMPTFLPLINKPVMNGNTLSFDMPAMPSDLAPVGMYITFSEIEQIGSGDTKIERRTRIWEIWSDAWLSQLELPKLTFNRRGDRIYRWEVLFLAHPSTSTSVDLGTVTHATRNALDL